MNSLPALCLLAALAGCKGESPRPSEAARSKPRLEAPEPTQTPAPRTARTDACPLEKRSLRHEQAARLVAIGDVHGDLAATRRALRLAGAIDGDDQWIGGKLVLVQTGDVLDRGDDEPEILELLSTLQEQAAAAGGAVHLLNGNHELMNALGDFRYVTREGFRDFAEGAVPDPLTAEARAKAFLPGGRYATKLAARDMVIVVGDSVFVHGGVLPRFVAELEQANRDARCFLLGKRKEPPPAIVDPEGPLWTREFSKEDAACDTLGETLEQLGVSRMVVGHTPQLGGITSACKGRVWRIDTGMAGFYRGPTQVLEIREGVVRVLE